MCIPGEHCVSLLLLVVGEGEGGRRMRGDDKGSKGGMSRLPRAENLRQGKTLCSVEPHRPA